MQDIPSKQQLAAPLKQAIRARSALARLQQGLMAAGLVFTVIWLIYWWPRSPLVALLGAFPNFLKRWLVTTGAEFREAIGKGAVDNGFPARRW